MYTVFTNKIAMQLRYADQQDIQRTHRETKRFNYTFIRKLDGEKFDLKHTHSVRSYHIDTSVLSSSRLRFSNESLSSSSNRSSGPTPLSDDELIIIIVIECRMSELCLRARTRGECKAKEIRKLKKKKRKTKNRTKKKKKKFTRDSHIAGDAIAINGVRRRVKARTYAADTYGSTNACVHKSSQRGTSDQFTRIACGIPSVPSDTRPHAMPVKYRS